MNLASKNRVKILSDFNSNLEMFNLKNEILTKVRLSNKYKIALEFIDTRNLKKIYHGDVYWGTKINKNILSKIKNLKWIHFGSVGTDKINVNKLTQSGIKVTNSKGINSDYMVNLILFYLLDTSKRLLFFKSGGSRENYEILFERCKDVNEQKICILGHGSISKNLQKHLNYMNLNYLCFSRRNLKIKTLIGEKKFLKNIGKFDIIINLLKSENKNENFLNQELFKRMKKNVDLILVGRLKTVNLKDLNNFMLRNKNANCYIDAINDQHQKNYFNMLKKNKNIYLSPHIGGYFKEYWVKQSNLFINNLKRFIKKEKLINAIK